RYTAADFLKASKTADENSNAFYSVAIEVNATGQAKRWDERNLRLRRRVLRRDAGYRISHVARRRRANHARRLRPRFAGRRRKGPVQPRSESFTRPNRQWDDAAARRRCGSLVFDRPGND